jgi:4-amino-4-deoxy-L-arabinose transferase-like glycosyltransferase
LSLPRDLKTANWKTVLNKLAAQIFEMKLLLGLGVILAVNLPWYIMASLATNGQFLYDFFIRQNFGRMMGTVNHQEPIYFYIPVFFGGFFPWCAFSFCAPGLFRKSFALSHRKGLTKNSADNTANIVNTASSGTQGRDSQLRQLVRIVVFWFASVIILFTAIKTKLPTYILPCAPAFSILLALQWELLAQTRALKILKAPTAFIILALGVAAGLIALSLLGGINVVSAMKAIKEGYVRDIIVQQSWLIAPWAVSLGLAWIGLQKKNIRLYAISFLSFALLTCAILVPRAMQISYQQKQLGFNELACRVRDDKANVAMIFAEEPSVPWCTHKPVARLSSREDAQQFVRSVDRPRYVLVQTGNLARLDWFDAHARSVAENGKWHLFSLD